MFRAFFYLVAFALMVGGAPAAAQSRLPYEPAPRAAVPKVKPPAKSSTSDSCANYGAGFVRVEGSNTCVKVGGSISVGGGWTR